MEVELAEVEACLAVLDTEATARDHVLIAMAAMTGLRVHELVALNWNQVLTDVHSPGYWRLTGPLSIMPEFRAAWGCKDGDPMVRAERPEIW